MVNATAKWVVRRRTIAIGMRSFDGRLRTLVCGFPTRDLLFHPYCAFFSVALEARVRAFRLTEALRHIGIRNIVDLMGTRAEQKCVHDARHVTRDAAAPFGFWSVVGVLRSAGTILKLTMTSGAHPVGLVAKL